METDAHHLLIPPGHIHKAGACLVCGPRHLVDERGGVMGDAIGGGIAHDQALPGAQVQADPDDGFGVFFQQRLVLFVGLHG